MQKMYSEMCKKFTIQNNVNIPQLMVDLEKMLKICHNAEVKTYSHLMKLPKKKKRIPKFYRLPYRKKTDNGWKHIENCRVSIRSDSFALNLIFSDLLRKDVYGRESIERIHNHEVSRRPKSCAGI
ncbi:unnamed protein product [Haemonchus placei]|uniref:Transposase n=1 Tax=Haemonchus placei TaxID=6290 RepID=A0A0N4X344_HAEPC|nr:unnamed protein product [Haemonchus placei]